MANTGRCTSRSGSIEKDERIPVGSQDLCGCVFACCCGVGVQVTVVAGDLTQVDEVHSGRGYQSHWGTRLHFGLGKRDRVNRIEVRWIGGGVDVLRDVEADRLLTITEGSP